jgi:MYXO-CTERM domain-containing protein
MKGTEKYDPDPGERGQPGEMGVGVVVLIAAATAFSRSRRRRHRR